MKLEEENKRIPYYDLLYSLKKENKKLVEKSAWEQDLSSAYKRASMTPVALELIKWMTDNRFQFIKLLFYRKTFQKQHNSSYSNNKLREAYAAYFQAIKSLKESHDSKEYVLGAFLLQQFEPVFEHMIAACLAVCKEELPFYVSMFSLRLATVPWWHCELLCSNRNKKKLYLKTAGDYALLMEAAKKYSFFENKDSRLAQGQYIRKILLDDLLSAHFKMNEYRLLKMLGEDTDYPVGEYNPLESDIKVREIYFKLFYKKWTDDDYAAVEDFLRKEYPIIDNHISFYLGDPMKWSDSMVESIRDYYDPLFDSSFGFVRCQVARRKQYTLCRKCHKKTKLIKNGFTSAHIQRYICERCKKTFTLEAKKSYTLWIKRYWLWKCLTIGKVYERLPMHLGAARPLYTTGNKQNKL